MLQTIIPNRSTKGRRKKAGRPRKVWRVSTIMRELTVQEATGREVVDAHGLWWPGRPEEFSPLNEKAVEFCRRLLEGITITKRPTIYSYGAKHIAEKAAGFYISNGDLIEAARRAGVPLAFCPGHLNAFLFVSKRDLLERLRLARAAA
jgi:hypothetical protein